MLKWNLKGWKPRPFALEAQEMYIGMNQAIFRYTISRREILNAVQCLEI